MLPVTWIWAKTKEKYLSIESYRVTHRPIGECASVGCECPHITWMWAKPLESQGAESHFLWCERCHVEADITNQQTWILTTETCDEQSHEILSLKTHKVGVCPVPTLDVCILLAGVVLHVLGWDNGPPLLLEVDEDLHLLSFPCSKHVTVTKDKCMINEGTYSTVC